MRYRLISDGELTAAADLSLVSGVRSPDANTEGIDDDNAPDEVGKIL